MQVGEAADVAIAESNHDPDCYFCNAKKEPTPEENVFADDPEDDEDLDGASPEGIKFKNDSSKLGKALGGTPPARTLKLVEKPYDVSVAAHHLIPGNAALKQSDLYQSKEYLWTDGKVNGNIGYDVNSNPNGEWLPGNYAMRPWGSGGAAFMAKTGLAPKLYAFAAIRTWNGQFHDAHEDYSTFVVGVLDKIHQKLKAGKDIWCPKAKEEEDKPENRKPLYILVNRLHTVSGRMRRMLVFPTANWKKNIWTSRFSLEFMNEEPHAT